MNRLGLFALAVMMCCTGLAAADDPAALPAAKGTRRALIICGLAGDETHRKLFAESVEKIYTGLTTRENFTIQNVQVLWSDAATDKDGPALKASKLLSRESLASTTEELQKALQPEDALWVFVLGHMHYDGRYSFFNIPGADIQQMEFGKLFAGIKSNEQAFFITTSASGFYLKPLAMPGRVVIAATEPDFEVNETNFPHHLAKGLAEPLDMKEVDIDEDGQYTLLDLYLWTAKSVATEYKTGELLATEHALLDDNGDGRGSELQAEYLPEDLGGKLKAGRAKPMLRPGDGDAARKIRLATPPEKKPEEEKPADPEKKPEPEAKPEAEKTDD